MTRSWTTLENVRHGGALLGPGRTITDLDEDLAAELQAAGAIAADDDDEQFVPERGDGPAEDCVAALNILDSAGIETAAALIAASEAACMQLGRLGLSVQAIHEGGDPAQTDHPSRVKDGGAGPSDRVDQIRSAVQAILAKNNPADLTKSGLPTVPAIEAATGIDDVSAAERNDAVAWAAEQGK